MYKVGEEKKKVRCHDVVDACLELCLISIIYCLPDCEKASSTLQCSRRPTQTALSLARPTRGRAHATLRPSCEGSARRARSAGGR